VSADRLLLIGWTYVAIGSVRVLDDAQPGGELPITIVLLLCLCSRPRCPSRRAGRERGRRRVLWISTGDIFQQMLRAS